ncbi:Cytokinin riboside 5'-monophosphate phosphoribohydrolase LOG5 [Vanrija pseudolonga]|uniref:Cytokinin riboside 5'-monophosphate phosphoribohydrolase LOG5 n=1 Tax=Vanrija pseudolonga TaxID=143232 RepID=A0AAF1BPR8_9TREE|nr:Cytokinin riboside 5'-monophosphate phosphoribohydrolase LOG5 [Vanrija pseudolonga]
MSPFPTDQELKKPVCAFCGSSPGSSTIYGDAAASVGAALAEASYPLVYGGGRRGLMGVVSQSHLKAGGYTHGVLPRALVARASEHTPAPSASAFTGTPKDNAPVKSAEGKGHDLLDDDFDGRLTMEVVGSMHERKAKMAQLSTGGFVVLPGGYGTFEELLEMVTWNQLGIHSVPVLVLNIGNFYTALQTLVENAVTAGFIQPINLKLMTVVNLPGGPEANADPTKAGEWGAATVKALQEWQFPTDGGYGFKWKDAESKASTA